jgi:hypothetical protein
MIVEYTSSLYEFGYEITSEMVCLGEEIAMAVSGGLRVDGAVTLFIGC